MTKGLALFPHDVAGFLRDSQTGKWQGLDALLGTKTATTVLDTLSKELALKGTLHVLRHGFKCYGKAFRMAYFRPNTAMNPEAAENYARNRLTITRPSRVRLGHEEARRQESALHHRRDACGQWHSRRHRRAQEPADRAAGRSRNQPVRERTGRARSSLRLQETRPGPLCRGHGRGVDDDATTGEGYRLPAVQPRQQPRGRKRAGRGQLEDCLPVGRGATGRQPPGNPAALHAPRREGKGRSRPARACAPCGRRQ